MLISIAGRYAIWKVPLSSIRRQADLRPTPSLNGRLVLSIACHRSSSVQRGLPTCVWPSVTHASAVNSNTVTKGSDGKTAYYRIFQPPPKLKEVFISGELVFFRPSPIITSCSLPKIAGVLSQAFFLSLVYAKGRTIVRPNHRVSIG